MNIKNITVESNIYQREHYPVSKILINESSEMISKSWTWKENDSMNFCLQIAL